MIREDDPVCKNLAAQQKTGTCRVLIQNVHNNSLF